MDHEEATVRRRRTSSARAIQVGRRAVTRTQGANGYAQRGFAPAHHGGGRMFAPPAHHGGGGHPTFTPTRTNTPVNTPTRTNTPVPTSTPPVTNTPAARTRRAPPPTLPRRRTRGATDCNGDATRRQRRVQHQPELQPVVGWTVLVSFRHELLAPHLSHPDRRWLGNGSSDPVTILDSRWSTSRATREHARATAATFGPGSSMRRSPLMATPAPTIRTSVCTSCGLRSNLHRIAPRPSRLRGLHCLHGGVPERFKGTVLKTVVGQKLTVGSNPTPSATNTT